MSQINIAGDTSGSIAIAAPLVAGSNTLTLPASTGTVLTSVSPASSLPSSINGPAFSAYQSSNQTITNNSWTKVQINTEEFDTNSNYDNATNYRFTPTVAGYYQINGATSIADTPYYGVSVYKNGSIFKQGNFAGAYSSAIQGAIVSCLVYLNGSTDYVELYIYQSSGVSKTTNAGSHLIYFQGSMVRGA